VNTVKIEVFGSGAVLQVAMWMIVVVIPLWKIHDLLGKILELLKSKNGGSR
jgi:hypothetical protein